MIKLNYKRVQEKCLKIGEKGSMTRKLLSWDDNMFKPLSILINDIKIIIGQLRWSDSMLAHKSGVRQSTVSRILSGQTTNPTYQTIERIIAAIKIGIDSYNRGKFYENKCAI